MTMKRMLTMLMLAPTVAWGGENLITNGDVTDVKDGKVTGWQARVQSNIVATVDVVTDAATTRGNVFHIKFESGEGSGQALWQAKIAKAEERIQAGKKYRLSLWMKYDLQAVPRVYGGPVARINFWSPTWTELLTVYLTPEGNAAQKEYGKLKFTKTKQDWTKLECVVTAPTGTHYAGVYLLTAVTPGEVWLDNVAVEPVEDATAEGPFGNR
jgi:hypothetical protein